MRTSAKETLLIYNSLTLGQKFRFKVLIDVKNKTKPADVPQFILNDGDSTVLLPLFTVKTLTPAGQNMNMLHTSLRGPKTRFD